MTTYAINNPPNSLAAGDSAVWEFSLSEYSAADGWSLKFTLVSASNRYTVTASGSGIDHTLTLDTSATTGWVPNDYTLAGFVEKSGQRVTLFSVPFKVLPNIAGASSGIDLRSPAKKALDALNAALESYGNKAYTYEYEIAGRRMRFQTPSEFMQMRTTLQQEVAREVAQDRAKNGGGFFGKQYVGF